MRTPLHDNRGARSDGLRRSRNRRRSALPALYTGAAMTVIATIVPYLDQVWSHRLAHHIRAGYPGYTQARIDTAVTTYEVILTVIGALGLASWAVAIYAVSVDRRWATAFVTVAFILGVGIALTNLLLKDTSGEVGLSPLLGWVGVLPCLPGLIAVTLQWRDS
jgi:hypothetical protein